MWDNFDKTVREDPIKTVTRSVISHGKDDNTGDVVINYLANKEVDAEWDKK